MSQKEFLDSELRLAAALHHLWFNQMRPLLMLSVLSQDERASAEEFSAALLAVSSCHTVLVKSVTDQNKSFPSAILEVLPSIRDSYLKYTALFDPNCSAVELITERYPLNCAPPGPSPPLTGVDLSPSSIAVMPMQILPKYVLLLKDAQKEELPDTDAIPRAISGVEQLCSDIDASQRRSLNATKVSEINAEYKKTILNGYDLVIDDAYFHDSLDADAKAYRAILCSDKLSVLSFKDVSGTKLRGVHSFPLNKVQSVRNNSQLGCLILEVQEGGRLQTVQLYSEDSLILSQWTMALSLGIDKVMQSV